MGRARETYRTREKGWPNNPRFVMPSLTARGGAVPISGPLKASRWPLVTSGEVSSRQEGVPLSRLEAIQFVAQVAEISVASAANSKTLQMKPFMVDLTRSEAMSSENEPWAIGRPEHGPSRHAKKKGLRLQSMVGHARKAAMGRNESLP